MVPIALMVVEQQSARVGPKCQLGASFASCFDCLQKSGRRKRIEFEPSIQIEFPSSAKKRRDPTCLSLRRKSEQAGRVLHLVYTSAPKETALMRPLLQVSGADEHARRRV